MDNMKRFVSFLLCFVMLLGFLPANAFAAGETTKTPVDALVVFSDLHIGTTGTKENNKATLLKSVLNQIKTKVGTVSSVNSAGDMFSSDKSTITSDTDKLNGYIREVFPNVPVNYVWTDHDRAADISKQSTLVEYDNYYIYTLSMGDLSSNDRYRTGFAYSESNNTNRVNSGFTPTVPEAIENFKNAVKNLDKNKPLFIVGHQPLFDNRDENAWAEDWVAAINEVATLMDVTYFSGHNHNYDLNESQTNKQDYYFAKGSTMPVPNRSSWDFNYHSGVQYDSNLSYTNVVLNFTHICAGYMDPGTTSGTTRKGTALAVEIYDDEIVYTTYNANGVYSGDYAVSESVERDHATSWTTLVEPTKSTFYVYEQVDTIVAGESYAIVGETSDYALNTKEITKGLAVATSGSTMTADFEVPLWTFEDETFGKIHSGDTYVSCWSSLTTGTAKRSSTFTITDKGNTFSLLCGSGHGDSPDYSLHCSGSGWCIQEKDGVVRLFASNGTTTVQNQDGLYGRIEGDTAYTVAAGSDLVNVVQLVKAGITAYTTNDPTNPVGTAISDNDLIVTSDYTNTSGAGEYTVTISYEVVELGKTVRKELGQVTLTAVESDSSTPSEPSVEYNEGNNYPEYPDEGAVKVSKTGTGIDFQSSGIARVEISASGVPMKRGVDIILMLDMSSSMKRHSYCGESSCSDRNCDKVTRLAELKEALVYMENYLKESGNADEMRIAIADFNGFFGSGGKSSGTAYDRDGSDNMGGTLNSNQSSHRTGVVYNAKTGATCDIGKDAFVPVSEMQISKVNAQLTNTRATTGTNYDHAFDVIYQLGHAIQEANGENQRELVVIFMSDGAPNQYNYYHSIGGQSNVSNTDDENYKWNKWLQGTFASNQLTATNIGCATHSYYYDWNDYDEDGIVNEHRMASAIKGDITDRPYYEVIRKNQNGTGKDDVTGLLESAGKDNLYKIPGLGATMYSIGFHIKNDGKITAKSVHHVLEQVASTPDKYIMADDETALTKAFNDIANDILYAAYNARYVDQMGKDYDLQMKPLTDLNGKFLDSEDPRSKIEVIEYDIYTRADYLSGKCTEDQIGDRKGTYKVLETVVFKFDGKTENGEKVYTVTGAYSSLLGDDTNILGSDGIIRAKNFYYNTTNKGVAIEGLDIPTGVDEHNLTTGTTNVLPGETFYWGMGTVKTTELALSYYVYLTGSMEGTREAGSYPTNNYANLYYDNYLDNPAHKDTVSPVLPWKEANVSYAFYLVNENGQIVVNQTTGTTGSFANKIAVTNPVVHSTIKLNSSEGIDAAKVAAAGVLPEGYTLYDADYDANGNILTGATYTVRINSNSTGHWEITGPKSDDTTYVMQYDRNNSAAYSNAEDENGQYDYTHTVVWFAVVWKIQPLPDTVVVDYGLPVDISVLANDMFGANGKLAGVGSMNTQGLTWNGYTADNLLSTNPYKGTYGTATVNTATGKVRYSLETMEMNSHEQFAYAVNYTGNKNAGYYYETVTVIPATTIYYEDSFVKYDSYTWDYDANAWAARASSLWSVEGNTVENAVQGEDRPGKYALTDANNIYGYDGVNLGMSTFSLGSAHKATVDYDNYASAQFTFYGTGFDIISMTDTTTGTILVEVEKQDANGAWSKFDGFSVDTYYGYKQISGDADNDGSIEEGEMIWVVNPDADGSIYQVPVIKMADKPYGHYRVTIKATYESFFDHVAPSNDNGSYDFYLDAIRIYDPANDGEGNKVIEDAYVADGEGWPSYIELRNALISAASFDEVANDAMDVPMTGLVFIDGDAEVGNAQLSDYVSFGPNNEVYLAPGQRVAFVLDTPDNLANVHIGISLATAGTTATYTITNIAKENREGGKVQKGTFYNPKTFQLDTATDMYYDLSGWKGDIIVISNTGNRDENGTTGVIAITNIKSTYKTNPNAAAPQSGDDTMQTENLTRIYMTPAVANVVLDALNTQENTQTPDEPTVPDVPEITEVFEPELFHVKLNKNEIKAGQKVLVTVTTSADVEYVMINGEKITKFIGGGTGNRTWKLNVTGERVGNMTVEVVCCNSKGIASEAVTEKVKVKAKGLLGSLDDILG